MSTKPKKMNTESYFTPPLVAELEVPECVCVFNDLDYHRMRRGAAFHAIHQIDCPRYCKDCLVARPCAKHRACNYIFYLTHPKEGPEYQF